MGLRNLCNSSAFKSQNITKQLNRKIVNYKDASEAWLTKNKLGSFLESRETISDRCFLSLMDKLVKHRQVQLSSVQNWFEQKDFKVGEKTLLQLSFMISPYNLLLLALYFSLTSITPNDVPTDMNWIILYKHFGI